MSLLKERLSRLKKEPSSVAANSIAVEERSADNSAAESSLSPRQSLGAAWDRLGACMQLNDWGQFIVRRLTYPLQYAHGTYRLGELVGEAEPLSRLTVAAKSGKRKAQAPAAESHRVSHSRMLFLDTETTGLGIGAGNVAFMVGIGFYETDAFVVEQMFIRNPSEEAAMLHHLRCRLAERDLLVSYNGKSFDWPIIKNRYILNRQKEHAVDPLHIDFLYPSRSLWRNTLPSCRLSSVERERLGLSRIDDVPGSLAPALYFQYLAEGDPTVVAGVFEHNEKDVLTLACLAVHLSRLAGGLVPTGRMEPEELYRLALWHDKLGQGERAVETFQELIEREEEAADYWLDTADYYKRQGRYEHAVALWEKAIERKRRTRLASLEPYVELAMYYEHQQKDVERALAYAELALERAQARVATAKRLEGKALDEIGPIVKRVERLRLKQNAAQLKTAKRSKRSSVQSYSASAPTITAQSLF